MEAWRDNNTLQQLFGSALVDVNQPVSAVTAIAAGRPSMVGGFNSKSVGPPMALDAPYRDSELVAGVQPTGRLELDVLGSGQIELACTGADRFADIAWGQAHAVPRVPDTAVFPAGAAKYFVEVKGGDHQVVLADVMSTEAMESSRLTYRSCEFGIPAMLDGRFG